jgi:Flp pilus assembly protein TadG
MTAARGLLRRLADFGAGFRRDRRGGVVVWLALATPPLVALGVLSVDVARIYNLEAELQSAADSMARAGAVELDGHDSAITRATAAVNDLTQNRRRFANGAGARVAVQRIRFLDALPASDADPVTADYETTDPNDAKYVEVTVAPAAISTLFPPQLAAGLASVTLNAKAVGGRMAQMCGAAPLFICNPVEGDAEWTLDQALDSPGLTGRQIRLRGKGGSSTYGPGMFGYLEPPGGSGASDMKLFFAEVTPDICYPAAGVTLRTGVVSSADQGVNTRLGQYSGSFRNTQAQYPAAQVTTAYPRDGCFASGGCTRVGDGGWDVVNYMRARGSPASVDIGGTVYAFNYASNTVLPSRPSRYAVYRWEIQRAGGTPPRTDSDRRVMPVAVLNCQAENLSASRIRVAAFAKVFLTEPMGSGTEDVIWGELVGALRWGEDRQVRDQVDVRR